MYAILNVMAKYPTLRKHKLFKPLIKIHGEAVFEERGNRFASLARAIVYQQITGKAASTILSRVLAACGVADIQDLTRDHILARTDDELRAAGLSSQKIKYLRDAAEKTGGEVALNSLDVLTNDEVVATLTKIKGIGVWSAHMFLMTTLNRPDILPVGDLGVQKGFQELYQLRSKPSEKKMRALAKEWAHEATYASWYLWRVSDEVTARGKKKKKR